MRRLTRALERISGAFDTAFPAVRPTAASGRVLAVGLRLIVLGVILQAVAHLVDWAVFDLRIETFNADQEWGTTAWSGTALTFVVAFLVAERAILASAGWLPLAVLAAVLAFLSLDDMISVHERVLLFDPEGNSLRYLNRVWWMMVWSPMLLYGFLGLWLIARNLEPGARRALRGGLLLLGSALALEGVGALILLLGTTRAQLPYNLEVVVEEGAELAGWGFIAVAIAASRYGRGTDPQDGEAEPTAEPRVAVSGR